MAHTHITPELLQALSQGDLPPEVFAMALWNHLLEVCPDCAEDFRVWLHRARSEGQAPTRSLRGLDLVAGGFSEKERKRAQRELAELRRVEPASRRSRIRNARVRFRSPLLADLLIERSNESLHTDPEAALHYAVLALTVAERARSPEGEERLVVASARVGNAHRARGKLDEAERYLREARLVLRRSLIADPLIYAEVDTLEASLRKDQRNFPAAKDLLNRSTVAFRVAGRKDREGKNLLKLSAVHLHAGEVELAIEVLYQALRLTAALNDPRFELWTRHNLALALIEAGDVQGAREIVEGAEPLYDRFKDVRTGLRRRWIQGRIARAEDSLRDAESALIETARGFVALNDGYDASLAYLDLAEIYHASGSSKKLRGLSDTITPILESKGLHREAMAALLLVQSAIREEAVTATLLRRARLYLNEARHNPALRFEDG